ncbi:MAG: hypothetical protein ABFS34_07080 [Gemmatimonadota bacterium]
MSDFEVFSVVLSFILGLGVAQILSAVVFAIQSRREIALSWTPFLWAFAIFLFHVNFLFAAFWFYSADRAFEWYLVDLISAVLIFLSGGLVLPSKARPATLDFGDFFDKDGRLALVPLGVFLLLAFPYNVQGGAPMIGPDNLVIAGLLVLTATAFFSRGRLRSVASAASAVLTTVAFLFFWIRPGQGAG